jgi:acyl-CoA synthetase (AMP-forming)/AMP-acid ligase II
MSSQVEHKQSLVSYLAAIQHMPDKGVCFIQGSFDELYISYSDLYSKALAVLKLLQQTGMRPGAELVIQLEDNHDFLITFWACLIGKIIPVPLSIGSQDDHKHKLVQVWERLGNPYMIAGEAHLARVADYCEKQGNVQVLAEIQHKCILQSALVCAEGEGVPEQISANDVAYIQFSSGSTGEPKGVVLTHANLIANVSDIISRSRINDGDAMLSWMPLTHDMGLICFHLSGVLAAIKQLIIPTALFIRNPVLWIDKASEHKATLLYSPNFGYQYFYTAAVSSPNTHNWDLSHVRLIYNGAEPISKDICTQFLEYLAPFGLNSLCMYPGYGLAEACVAVTLPTPGEPMTVHSLKRNSLKTGCRVEDVTGDDTSEVIRFMEVGYPIDHCKLRITDEEGRTLDENYIGNIEISGSNVTAGYYRNAAHTNDVMTADGWLKTRDIGFLRNGRLVITGRKKNIIIINGHWCRHW